MNIYPILKPSTWQGFEQADQKFVIDSVITDSDISDSLPKVVYAIDQNDSLSYVTENLFKGRSDDDVREKAYSDLRRELASENWEILDFNDKCAGLKVLVIQTPFYGSEIVLLSERLQEASSILVSDRLLACTPVRGQAFILPFDDENKAALEVFLGVCYENYSLPDNESISDVVWAIQGSEIKGILDVNKEFKNYHQSNSQPNNEIVSNKRVIADDGNDEYTTPQNVTSAISLFNPAQIGFGAFLGTPLAGLLLVAANLRAFNNARLANVIGMLAIIIMPLIIIAYVKIPETSFEKLFPLFSVILSLGVYKFVMPSNRKIIKKKRGFMSWLLYVIGSLVVVFSMVAIMFGAFNTL